MKNRLYCIFLRKRNTVDDSSIDIATTVTTSIVNIIFAAILWVAVSLNKPDYLLPWLVVFAIELIAGPIYLIYAIVILSIIGHWILVVTLLGIFIPVIGKFD